MSTGSNTASPPLSPTMMSSSAPKYGTLVPNRIFVGGISPQTTEDELHLLFSSYGNVKATKIILDRAGVSKGYGFVTFETEEEAKRLQTESDNIFFKDRKLNIAPAVKKQPFSRIYDPSMSSPTGSLLYHNGVPYTYQNGMAVFPSAVPPAAADFSMAAPAAAAAGGGQYAHMAAMAYQQPMLVQPHHQPTVSGGPAYHHPHQLYQPCTDCGPAIRYQQQHSLGSPHHHQHHPHAASHHHLQHQQAVAAAQQQQWQAWRWQTAAAPQLAYNTAQLGGSAAQQYVYATHSMAAAAHSPPAGLQMLAAAGAPPGPTAAGAEYYQLSPQQPFLYHPATAAYEPLPPVAVERDYASEADDDVTEPSVCSRHSSSATPSIPSDESAIFSPSNCSSQGAPPKYTIMTPSGSRVLVSQSGVPLYQIVTPYYSLMPSPQSVRPVPRAAACPRHGPSVPRAAGPYRPYNHRHPHIHHRPLLVRPVQQVRGVGGRGYSSPVRQSGGGPYTPRTLAATAVHSGAAPRHSKQQPASSSAGPGTDIGAAGDGPQQPPCGVDGAAMTPPPTPNRVEQTGRQQMDSANSRFQAMTI